VQFATLRELEEHDARDIFVRDATGYIVFWKNDTYHSPPKRAIWAPNWS